jgi:hypothetical protein
LLDLLLFLSYHMLCRSLGMFIADLALIVASFITTISLRLTSDRAAPTSKIGVCKATAAGTVGGPGTGYHSLQQRLDDRNSWWSGYQEGETADYDPIDSTLLLFAGPKAKGGTNNTFVFKINNWVTREPGINYAWHVDGGERCIANVKQDYIREESTFAVKVLPW